MSWQPDDLQIRKVAQVGQREQTITAAQVEVSEQAERWKGGGLKAGESTTAGESELGEVGEEGEGGDVGEGLAAGEVERVQPGQRRLSARGLGVG